MSLELVYRDAEHIVTLRPRQEFVLRLEAPASGRWLRVASSAPQLALIRSWLAREDGSAEAVVVGLRVGTATITAYGEGATLTLEVSVAPQSPES
ncbi:hypothetical protein ACGFZ9_46105 [Streptomyces mirabilis]|uniref:hypothetical protein n=1 Tax=Streptomyces mirabilis TaxID=68239 RepID=UPI0037139346